MVDPQRWVMQIVFFVMHMPFVLLYVNAPLLASACSILVVYKNVTYSW